MLTMAARRFIPNFLPQEAYGISPYKYTGTGQEQKDIPLGLQYRQENIAPSTLGPTSLPQNGAFLPGNGQAFDYGSSLLGGSGAFAPSTLSKDALRFLKERTGKEINIKPIDVFEKARMGDQSEGLMGFYKGQLPGEMPDQRTVFINQDSPAGLGTLFHEAGHAVDANLKQQHKIQNSFNPAYINSLSKPAARLNYLFEATGFPKVVSETEAQRFAGENLNEFQKQQQNNNKTTFDPKIFTDSPDYKFYPGSFAGRAVNSFFETELPGSRPLQQPLNPGSDTYDYNATGATVFTPPTAQKGVAFGTDPDLWRTQERIMQKTRDYVDPRLDQYMTNPTPAFENFWSPR
jgi:hypothetical protein